MTDKGIVYFHGYGSSPNTDKVTELRKHFSEVYAFPIDVDPDKSLPYLEEEIDNVLLGTINHKSPLVFVGTSLGAWYAARLAHMFGGPAVLINPAYSLDAIDVDLGISEEIKAKYDAWGFTFPENRSTFFIANNDEVIDFRGLYPKVSLNQVWMDESADHRFNGEPFNKVIEYIKSENL